MKAIVQERYGSPDHLELRDVEKPVVGDDDVLVRVRAASVHPDVWHVVEGRPYILRLMGAGFFRPKNPIPGTDMAGIVESVGKGVTRFQQGDPVFGETIAAQQWINGGAFAEYVSVPQDLLALKPDNITFEQAASVPTSGYIVLQNLRDPSRLRPGQTVLINGAGGGVGALALELAKAYGAHVTAVDSTRKLGMLRSLGLVPHFLKLIFLSRFVKQLRGPGIRVPTKKEAMAVLRELLEAGKITPVIDSTYHLHEAREALRHMIEDETRGKVIIAATVG